MPLHWQPVGPHEAATYWRRRAAVALAALLVLLLATLPLGGDDEPDRLAGATPAAKPTTDPAADPAADPTADPGADPGADPTADPTPDPTGGDVCPDTALKVLATADADSYPAGGTARLELIVRNTGTVPCRRALGQGAVELVVTSGDDRIWSSDDCAPGGPQDEVVLPPGGTSTARASWATVRSVPSCPGDQPAAAPGTYRVTGRVGELRVPGDAFTVG